MHKYVLRDVGILGIEFAKAGFGTSKLRVVTLCPHALLLLPLLLLQEGLVSTFSKAAPFLGPAAIVLQAVLETFIPDEEFTEADAMIMIEERLREFKKSFKKEIMQETQNLVTGSISANSFREAQLLMGKVTDGLSIAQSSKLLDTDAFLAYAMSFENDISHLAELQGAQSTPSVPIKKGR